MMNLQADFKEFLKLLNEHKVEYLLVGGYAVGHYGYVRATVDLDIWVNKTADNAEKLVRALNEFGFFESVNSQMFQKENNIVRMGVPPFRIEVMTSVSGLTFDESFKNKVVVDLDGQEVSVIALEDLKRNKSASGRHKDLSDLEYLP